VHDDLLGYSNRTIPTTVQIGADHTAGVGTLLLAVLFGNPGAMGTQAAASMILVRRISLSNDSLVVKKATASRGRLQILENQSEFQSCGVEIKAATFYADKFPVV